MGVGKKEGLQPICLKGGRNEYKRKNEKKKTRGGGVWFKHCRLVF